MHTRFRAAVLLNKRETEDHLLSAITKTGQHFGRPLKWLPVDANEFLVNLVIKFLSQRGVTVNLRTPHAPKENLVSERVNRMVFGRVRATLATVKLPFKYYWLGVPWIRSSKWTVLGKEQSKHFPKSCGTNSGYPTAQSVQLRLIQPSFMSSLSMHLFLGYRKMETGKLRIISTIFHTVCDTH